ncbi:MAG: NACHT domain-containing protein, partial [bacterium]|nr:NACHT domain-containing protein [bacterium]
MYQKTRDGVWTFPLAAHLKIDSEAPASVGELSDARRSTLTARYRAAAAAVHGTPRFVGLASYRRGPNVRVPELFVPLRLKVWGTGEDAPDWTTGELIARLAEPVENGEAARVVVLGGPGSGKTTLCRFATVCLAGEGPREYADPCQELLPLFLPLRDYVRACNEGEDRSLLDFLVDEARNRLQVPVPQSFLEHALDEGRAVLLLDGFDEVGSAGEREGMRERVQALCRLYPRTPVLLTSRTAGYEDAPVPRHFRSTPGFDHVALTEFDDEDLHQFVARWYAVQEPGDPVARDRGIADLTASIELNPHVRNLARNPMLATLIALVHRYEAHLPGERAMLYDIAVKTLIETRPAARRLPFREIDERLQRAYLQELAFRMQSSRGEDDREVVIRRDSLIAELVDIIQRREGSARSPEETTGLVERWSRFLEEEAGILVEQQPGIFGFIHLSLMEYLAAGGLEAVADEALEEAIARRCTSPVWREVCLLVVGRWATNKLIVDRLYRRLSEHGQWLFLLACLREEAAFDDEQRASIVRNVARQRHEAASWEWRRQEEILDGVMRLSIRHAAWAGSWIGQQIRSAEGDALAGIVALRLGRPDALVSELNGRSDAVQVAGDLLDFWPHHAVGRWAVKRVSPQGALDWALRRAGDDFIVLRSRAALTADSQALAAPLVARLARSAANLIPAAQAWTDSLAPHPWPGDHGLPLMVQAEPGFNRTGIRPRWPVPETPRPAGKTTSGNVFLRQDFYRYFAAELIEDLRDDFTVRFGVAYSPWPIDLYFLFDRDIDPGFSRDFAELLADDFRKHLIVFFMRNMDFADFRLKLVFNNGDQLSLWNGADGLGKSSRYLPSIPAPTSFESAAAIHPVNYVPEVLARRAAEAWVAMATTIGRPDDQRRAYLRQRHVHGEILSVWPALDARLGDRPSADALALYLTLGWTQATTTWQWPATER